MKLPGFKHDSKSGFGAGEINLGGHFVDLKSIPEGSALVETAEALEGGVPNLPLVDLTLQPVLTIHCKNWYYGLNYGNHFLETNREVTEQPTFFLRVANSNVGPYRRARAVVSVNNFQGVFAVGVDPIATLGTYQ